MKIFYNFNAELKFVLLFNLPILFVKRNKLIKFPIYFVNKKYIILKTINV